MIGKRFAARYSEILARDLPGLIEVLAELDPYKAWKTNYMPDSTARRYFVHALFLRYAKHTGSETLTFLKVALEICNRVLLERKYEARDCVIRFPANRGEILRIKSYGESLLGAALNVAALRQASLDFEAYCSTIGPHDWDETTQPIFLSAIRLSLITRDTERAKQLVSWRKCTGRQRKEQLLWRDMPAVAEHGDVQNLDGLLDTFQLVFDRAKS